jgi:hypothetical protein
VGLRASYKFDKAYSLAVQMIQESQEFGVGCFA